ncbi:phage tail protein [Ferrovibrio sp.]|uniref:phage tail protein n=1 Tax=Ferrovibrio sp. TaxID=1917215 RepID=UPI003D2A2DF4
MADAFLGEIRLFASYYAPTNWLPCNGQLLSISQYNALFSVIGTTYGGDGRANFALPNLQGRLVIGTGTYTSPPDPVTTYAVGNLGGVMQVVLTDATMPAHTHGFQAVNVEGSIAAPSPAVMLADTPDNLPMYLPKTTGTLRAFDPTALSVEGQSEPHENRMPATAMTYMICTVGLYPTPGN